MTLDLSSDGVDGPAGLSPLALAIAKGDRPGLIAPMVPADPRWIGDQGLASSALSVPLTLPSAQPGADRVRLAESLASANRALGHPGADAQAERLADTSARVVVTGQQPGLFGGPLYCLTKAVAAVRWAERIAETTGEPAVAVFWMATEDHDFREVASANFQVGEGVESVTLEDPLASEMAPVAARQLGNCCDLLESVATRTPWPAWGETLRKLSRHYCVDAGFGSAFGALLVELLGGRCPLLLDSTDPELKRQQVPFLRWLIERRAELDDALRAREEEITKGGYGLQVSPQPGASPPIFVIEDGCRRRAEWSGSDHFVLRGDPEGTKRPVVELLELLEVEPARVSPGALARPLVQDAVLGTTLQVLGAGEMSYMAQASALYEPLGVAAPAAALRPQIAVIGERRVEQIEQLVAEGIELAVMVGSAARLEEALAERQPVDFIEGDTAAVLAALDAMGERALLLDPQLGAGYQKTRDRVAKGLEQFGARIRAAAARRDEVLHRRVATLRDALLPGGSLQERSLSVGHFVGRHGTSIGRSLLEELDVRPMTLQILGLTETSSAAEAQAS